MKTSDDLSAQGEFRETFLPYLDEIYSAAIRLTHGPAEADDLVNTTFSKAWSDFHQWERGTNIKVWLYQVLMKEHRTNNKNISKNSAIDLVPPKPSLKFSIYKELNENYFQRHGNSFMTLMDKLSEQDILSALRSLTDGFRQTLILSDFQRLSHEEIAITLEDSVEFVRLHLNMGRHYFQKALWEQANLTATEQEIPEKIMAKSFCLERA